jgi:hypothetical protein
MKVGMRKKKGRAPMIKTVIRLRNNLVVVFDAEGEQIPEYQGQYENVKGKILRDAPPGTVFNQWFGYSLFPRAVAERDW